MQILLKDYAGGVPRARRRPPIIAAFALCLIALAGCASQPAAKRSPELNIDASDVRTPAVKRRSAYEYHVLAGEIAIQRDQREVAAREYVAALDYSKDAELAKRATRIALFADNPPLAYRAATTWAAAKTDSLDAQRTAARLALTNGDAKGLAVYAASTVSAAASPDIGYRLLADVLSGEPVQSALAVQTARQLAEQDSNSAPAQYMLGVLALRYDRNDLAEQAATRAVALDPQWNEAVLLSAGVAIRNDEPDKAQALVNDLPGNNATRAQYHMTLARLLIEAQQDDAALDEFQHAIDLQPNSADARFGLAILSLSVGDLERAETAFTELYQDNERADDAAYYLGTVHEQRNEYGPAQRWYQRVESGSHAFESQVRAARMIYQQGNLAGARARLSELRGVYPELAGQLYSAEGQILYEADRPQASVELYNEGLEQMPDNADLLYGRSMAYERLDRIPAAKADLQTMLDQNSADARALNALGYLLTNHSRNHDQALTYIEQALQSEPDNPAILDSLGWVHYHLGHLRKARRYIEQAYEAFPDGEVAAHLGEVLWKQGDHDAARKVWQDALADDPDNRVLLATMKRLEQ